MENQFSNRKFNPETDYETVKLWWQDWGWPPLPLNFLSQNGVIVSKYGIDVAAGWIYSTDCDACWLENYISNKQVTKELRVGSIEYLIETMLERARDMGFLAALSSVKNPNLINKLLSAGFDSKTETGMTNLTRVL